CMDLAGPLHRRAGQELRGCHRAHRVILECVPVKASCAEITNVINVCFMECGIVPQWHLGTGALLDGLPRRDASPPTGSGPLGRVLAEIDARASENTAGLVEIQSYPPALVEEG